MYINGFRPIKTLHVARSSKFATPPVWLWARAHFEWIPSVIKIPVDGTLGLRGGFRKAGGSWTF